MKRSTIAAIAAAVASIATVVVAIASGSDTPAKTQWPTTSGSRPAAATTAAARTVPQGTLGKPLTVAGRFTITITAPVDTNSKWACNPVGHDGHCQFHAAVTVTVTAIEPVAIEQLELKAFDDNYEKLWLGEIGAADVLPAGKTHERDIAIDYQDYAKTRALPLIWLNLAGDEAHLAEWSYPG